MAKNVAFYVDETANAYALKTLHDAIKPLFSEHNLYFINRHQNRAIEHILIGGDPEYKHLPGYRNLPGGQHALYHTHPDLVLMSYSDILEDLSRYERGPYRTVAVDAAILKACKPLLSESRKLEIKKEYGLENISKPITVIGRVGYDENGRHQDIIKALMPYSQIITVASGESGLKKYYLPQLTEEERNQVIDVEGRGKLANLYSIADIAISGRNLQKYDCQLNNFFEQTQNSPIFMVLPGKLGQYGFQEFLKKGLVMPCNDVDDIISRSKDYLLSLDSGKKLMHLNNRTAFTQRAIAEEMPRIASKIMDILCSGTEKDLFRYIHPESGWKVNDYQSKEYSDIYAIDRDILITQ